MPSQRDTARQFPWDRVPTVALLATDANKNGSAPVTTLWSYTVPANRKAYIDSIYGSILVTAAGVGNELRQVLFSVNTGSGAVLLMAINAYLDAVGTLAAFGITGLGGVLAGTVVTAQYSTASNNGTQRVVAAMKYTEHQA